MNVTIYHNPRCSKSRQTLALLEGRGIQLNIIHYLETPLDTTTLKSILKSLNLPARQLLRHGESIYKEMGLDDDTLSEDILIKAMVKHPILIERPIVVHGNHAVIGRPPENVLNIL